MNDYVMNKAIDLFVAFIMFFVCVLLFTPIALYKDIRTKGWKFNHLWLVWEKWLTLILH